MTILISDNSPRISYTATAGQTAFTVPFEFFDNTDLNVYINDTLQTLTTHYSVTGGGGSTGSITLVTGATVGDVVIITRDVTLERTTDFPTSGPFQVASLNVELDKMVAMVADMKDLADRGLRLEDFDPTVSLTIPSKDNRKGTVLAFNETTGAVEVGPTIADTNTIAQIKADIATLADIQDGTVATNAITNLSAVSSDVTTAASNITEIQNAPANAATATTKASEASASAAAAATSETNAGTSETNAASSATAAAASATSASNAQTAAESARDSALAAYDNFDDRYLGVKSSDPTVDNDGDALVAGALYFNSTSGDMKVYNGTSWVDAYADGATLVSKSGDTMTGDLYFLQSNKIKMGATDLNGNTHTIGNDSNDNIEITTSFQKSILLKPDSGVFLFDGGSLSMSTTAIGINVNGTIQGNGLSLTSGGQFGGNVRVGGAIEFSGLAPTMDYDFDDSGYVGSDDALDYAQMGTGKATGVDISSVDTITPSWSALSGSTYSDNKFRIMSARGNATDALRITSSLTAEGHGDTTIIGNINADGVNTRIITGLSISGGDVELLSNDSRRVNIAANGDISFFEDTGTTAKLEWLASDEDLKFADNSKAIFGAGSDLEIYHNGTNSIVADVGQGTLSLQSNGAGITLWDSANSQEMAQFYTGAVSKGVTLSRNGVEKLATTASGIDVTGTVTAEGLTISDDYPQIVFTDTNHNPDWTLIGANGRIGFYDATNSVEVATINSTGIDVTGTVTADGLSVSAASGSNIRYDVASSNPHTNPILHLENQNTTDGNVAALMLSADNANGVGGSAYIYAQSETANQKGNLLFAREDGANNPTTSMKLSSNGDISFYNSAGTSQSLFWDAGEERLGLGTTSPSTNLHISDPNPAIRLEENDETSHFGIIQFNSDALRIRARANTARGGIRFEGQNDINTVEYARFNNQGYLGIGTSSPVRALHVNGGTLDAVALFESSDSKSGIIFKDSTTTAANGVGIFAQGDNATIYTDDTERMRIDSSGEIYIDGTGRASSNNGAYTALRNGDSDNIETYRIGTGTRSHHNFYNGSFGNRAFVGAIKTSGSSTSYNTTSDHRLKENVTGITDGIERVKQLNPSRFNFIADADTTVDGFIAHEAQTVVPEAITGEKDAMRDEEYEVTPAVYEDVVIPAVLDDDGNEIEAERTEQQLVTEAVMGTRSVPDYQGIDQAKLVPLLTAALQEAITKIEDLEARVATLEGN